MDTLYVREGKIDNTLKLEPTYLLYQSQPAHNKTGVKTPTKMLMAVNEWTEKVVHSNTFANKHQKKVKKS